MNSYFKSSLKQVLCAFMMLLIVSSCKGQDPGTDGPAKEIKTQKSETPASVENEGLNIMSFNILWDKETAGPMQWSLRRPGMVNLIKRHRPDFIGVQEGFIDQSNWLKGELHYDFFGWGTDDGKSQLQDPAKVQSINPIMYDASRFTVLEKGVFWFGEQSNAPGKYANDTQFRNCVWGSFSNKAGKIFYVFNTHLSLTDDIRQKQAGILKAKIAEIAGKDAPVIVTGDFNSDPVRDLSYGILTNTNQEPVLSDSRRISTSPPIGTAFTASGSKVNSRTSGFQVDHILIRNIRFCTEFKTINDFEGDYYPSDHFPVLAVLKF